MNPIQKALLQNIQNNTAQVQPTYTMSDIANTVPLQNIQSQDAQAEQEGQNYLKAQQQMASAMQAERGDGSMNGANEGNDVTDKIPANLRNQNSVLGEDGPITETFGQVQPGVEVFTKGAKTPGVGIGVPTGTSVAAPPGNWRVISSYGGGTTGGIGNDTNQGWGNSIVLQNQDNGDSLRFSHLSKNYMPINTNVSGGQIIGLSGATGNATGPHLNIAYYTNTGSLANPLTSPYAGYINHK